MIVRILPDAMQVGPVLGHMPDRVRVGIVPHAVFAAAFDRAGVREKPCSIASSNPPKCSRSAAAILPMAPVAAFHTGSASAVGSS